MGAWSEKALGNDEALDWLNRLASQRDASAYIMAAVDREIGANDPPERSSETIAAAAIIAAAACEPIGPLSKEAKAWIVEHGFVPNHAMIAKALIAMERITTQSEMRDIWDECDELPRWLKENKRIIDSLKARGADSLPARNPKKKSIPRSLPKLLEAYAKNPQEPLQTKLHEKLRALTDLNDIGPETDYQLPLSLVAAHGLVEETRLLLDWGADPNAAGSLISPPPLSCAYGHVEVAKILLARGAQLFNKVTNHSMTKHLPQDAATDSWHGRTGFRYSQPLLHAARLGTVEVIDLFIAHGADIHQKDLNGETLLHNACEVGNIYVVQHLIRLGLDINATTAADATALHYAVYNNHITPVQLLLDAGAQPNIISQEWGTVLDILAEEPDSNLATLIRRYGGLTSAELGS
ncbi:MAG: ankyrin repeat domain-containing protein [Verrucomicrobiota bacterium]|nr:ankyrin repeat domain-containing protein [Verrucomicrobiota bacterium]